MFGKLKHDAPYENGCRNDCFDIPEWYEFYYFDDGVVYVLNADGRTLSAYRGEKLEWKRFLGRGFGLTGAVDFLVSSEQAFYLDQSGKLFRINVNTGKIEKASEPIREGDYQHISLDNYKLEINNHIVVVKNLIKDWFCYDKTTLGNAQCPSYIEENRADFLLEGDWWVKKVTEGFVWAL